MPHSHIKSLASMLTLISALPLVGVQNVDAQALCPGGPTPPGQVCVRVQTDSPSDPTLFFVEPAPFAFAATIGDYTLVLVADFNATAGGMEVDLAGTVTRGNSPGSATVSVAVEGTVPNPLPLGGNGSLFLDGIQTGPGIAWVGGAAGFPAGTDLSFTGFPVVLQQVGFGAEAFDLDEFNAGPVATGSIALRSNNVFDLNPGTSMMIPSGTGAGEPIFPEESARQVALRLRVGDKLEHFAFEQFWIVYDEECDGEIFVPRPDLDAVTSLEGGQLTMPKPCGFGLVSEVWIQTVAIIDQPTILDEDFEMPDGTSLLITEEGSLIIPNESNLTIHGDETTVANRGELIAEGGLLVGKGSTLDNQGLIVVYNALENYGNLCNGESGVIENSESLSNLSSGLIYNLGTINNSNFFCNEGRIKDGGVIDGNPIESKCEDSTIL